MLFGKRWMYREDPEFSNAAVAYVKFAAVLAMLIQTIIVASLIFDSYLIRLLLVLALFLYIIYSVFKLRKKVLN